MSLDVYLTMNDTVVFDGNITHNLNMMADAAGIYKVLWHPDWLEITKASQLIEPLTNGLIELASNPEKYKQYDSTNGWGMYEHFVPWVAKYLRACIDYPAATVSARN